MPPTPNESQSKMRATIVRVLSSTPCKRINFKFGANVVNAAGYQKVSALVMAGRFNLSVGSEPGVAAKYNKKSNTFIFPHMDYGQNNEQKAAIAHECTHALQDLDSLKTTELNDEIAAYIAHHLFLIYASTGADGMPVKAFRGGTPTEKIHNRAFNIATMIWLNPGLDLKDAGPEVQGEVVALSNDIRENPLYAALKANPTMGVNNGVP